MRIHNQLSRRNLPPDHTSSLRGKRYMGQKQAHGGDCKQQGSSGHCDHLKTEEAQAAEMKVSPRTGRRDATYAQAVNQIVESCGPQARQAILSREAGLSRKEVEELAEQKPAEQGKKARAGVLPCPSFPGAIRFRDM